MGPSGGIGSCCRRSRTAFASHSRCWEYWSVFELTPPSAGLEAGRCRFRGEGGRIRIRDQPHAPSTTQRRMVLRSWMNTPCAGLKQVRRVEKPSNGMPRICWQTIFICGKLQWYGKPLKQLRLLSRQADIRRVTDASSVNLSRCRARSGVPSYKISERKIAARCPGVPATRSNARRFHIIVDFSISSTLRPWG